MRWIGRHAHGSESEVIAHGRPTCSQRTGPTELHHVVVRRACAMASALFPHAYLTVNREAALMRELVNSRVVGFEGADSAKWHGRLSELNPTDESITSALLVTRPRSEELQPACAQSPTLVGSATTDGLNPLSRSQKPIVTSKTPRGAK